MNASPSPNAIQIQADNNSYRGVLASTAGDRSKAVFNLALDIGSLNPRNRWIARPLLLRINRKKNFKPSAR